jgi:MoaA/NifB/PqqE/SkfB family radical SAM enzyme
MESDLSWGSQPASVAFFCAIAIQLRGAKAEPLATRRNYEGNRAVDGLRQKGRSTIRVFVLGEWNVSEDYPPAWTDSAEPDPVTWQENSIRCSLPWREMRTDYDGGVTACCWGPKKLGSLREQTMKEIWNGETMQEMRSDLVAGRVPDACKGSACQFLSKRG